MKQAEIVKQRLNYHFRKTDGGWLIPENMPFMNEFLNEVSKLCELANGAEQRESNCNIPLVSTRYFAKIKYYPCTGGEPIWTVDEVDATSIEHATELFNDIWHMNAEVKCVYK